LVFHEPQDMRITEIDPAAVGPGDVLVRVRHAGICGTDLRIYRGTKRVAGPRVIGHEFAGTLAEVGSEVSDLDVGDRVVVYPIITCGHCYACAAGRKNICANRKTFGYEFDGGFAEYVHVPAAAVAAGCVIRVPAAVSDIAAGASEPAAAALQGIKRAGDLTDKTVLVMGGGPLGLAHVQFSKLYGAGQVVLSEPDAVRREQGIEFGADQAHSPEVLMAAVGGEVEVVFIDAGVPALVNDALAVLRKGGRCVIFAGMPEGATATFEPNRVHYAEIDLIGSSGSTPELQAAVLEHLARGELDLDRVVSDVLALEDWRRGFEMKQDVRGLKVLLDLG
jgi:L-iditol 2-dehydrogenase